MKNFIRPALALLTVAAIAAGCGGGTSAGEQQANTVEDTTPAAATVTTPPPAPVATFRKAGPKDFGMSVKILTQECFGSGMGCAVTYRPQLNSIAPGIDPSETYEVIFEVRGLTDGPSQGRLTIIGGEFDAPALENFGQTAGRVKGLPIRVLSVETMAS